jgi:hypothetical protein
VVKPSPEVNQVTDLETIKQEVELLTTQAEYWRRCWNARREYEWKITIGIWTLALLSVGFAKGGLPAWAVIVIASLLLLLCLFWLKGLWKANGADRSMEEGYLQKVDDLLLSRLPEETRKRRETSKEEGAKFRQGKKYFLLHWSMGTQFGGTVVLIAFAALTLLFRRPPEPQGIAIVETAKIATAAITALAQSNATYIELSKETLATLTEIKQNAVRPLARRPR